MENASKALLIAGGVLIAMLVASLGVYFAKTMSEHNARIYAQLEESERTEFNEQFIKFNKADSINIQDVVTLINLAKDSNLRNGFTNSNAPTDRRNNNSYYITVDLSTSTFQEIDPTTGVNVLTDNGTTYQKEFAEQFTYNILTNILSRDATTNKLYSCEIFTNENTGYVNYIKIN